MKFLDKLNVFKRITKLEKEIKQKTEENLTIVDEYNQVIDCLVKEGNKQFRTLQNINKNLEEMNKRLQQSTKKIDDLWLMGDLDIKPDLDKRSENVS